MANSAVQCSATYAWYHMHHPPTALDVISTNVATSLDVIAFYTLCFSARVCLQILNNSG